MNRWTVSGAIKSRGNAARVTRTIIRTTPRRRRRRPKLLLSRPFFAVEPFLPEYLLHEGFSLLSESILVPVIFHHHVGSTGLLLRSELTSLYSAELVLRSEERRVGKEW